MKNDMINQYFLPLNIEKKDIFKPNWIRPNVVPVKWEKIDYVKSIFSEYFFDKLNSIKEIEGTMIFKKIYHQNPIDAHIDINIHNNKVILIPYGLNIVFDDNTDMKSKMCWYSPKNEINEQQIKYTIAKTPYINYSIKDLILQEEQYFGEGVALVRTDVPHAIFSGKKNRTCLSIRFKNYNEGWENGYNLFNNAFNQ